MLPWENIKYIDSNYEHTINHTNRHTYTHARMHTHTRTHERICASCSKRVHKYIRWCTQHLFNVNTCTCMVLRTPVWMHTTLPARNAHAPVHAHPCNGAETSLPWKLLRTYLESCTSIVQAVICHPLLPPLLLSRPNPSPDAVRSRNIQIHASSWHGRRCCVAQASFDHPRWCSPHPVCLWVALAFGYKAHSPQDSISTILFAGFQVIN